MNNNKSTENGVTLMDMTLSKELNKNQPRQNHPDLEQLFFIDRLTGERLHPNGEPIDVDNEIYSGKLLIMVRTCDADKKTEPTFTGGTASNDRVSNYLRPKKRRFEIQLQIKFKKVLDSQIFLSIEYDQPVKLNLISRTSLATAMKFCKMKNPTFCYALSGKEKATEEELQNGSYENPHFAFPIETGLDIMKITKPGEKLPKLGQEIHEDVEALKKRRTQGIDYNTDDTYTISLYNAYVDFVQWKAVNLPAVPQFSLANVNGAQPMAVKLYALNSDGEKHLKKDLTSILDVEVSRRGATTFGDGAREWMEENLSKEATEDDSSITSFHTSFSQSEQDVIEEKVTSKKPCCRIM